MTDITITNGASVKFTFQDGDVDRVTSNIKSSADTMPMPMSPPADTIAFDLGGVVKRITISGALHVATTTRTSSGTTTSILQQKQWLEALASGSQTGMLFTSNYESYTNDNSAGWKASPPAPTTTTTKIIVDEIMFDEEEGNPNELKYRMTLLVVST